MRGHRGKAELCLFVGFLYFNTLFQNSARISPECHRNFTGGSPEIHWNFNRSSPEYRIRAPEQKGLPQISLPTDWHKGSLWLVRHRRRGALASAASCAPGQLGRRSGHTHHRARLWVSACFARGWLLFVFVWLTCFTRHHAKCGMLVVYSWQVLKVRH